MILNFRKGFESTFSESEKSLLRIYKSLKYPHWCRKRYLKWNFSAGHILKLGQRKLHPKMANLCQCCALLEELHVNIWWKRSRSLYGKRQGAPQSPCHPQETKDDQRRCKVDTLWGRIFHFTSSSFVWISDGVTGSTAISAVCLVQHAT